MYHSKINIAIASIGLIVLSSACKKQPDPVTTQPPTATTGKIGFEVTNYAGAKELVMNTETYSTGNGEDFIVTKFNYYISNIRFQKKDGTEYAESESYHLVQGNLASSKHFHIKDVPTGTYTGVTFLIGVDSARNTDGAQTGALDPSNGMFWSWSTGYIMAKLEGTSPLSTKADKTFTWHVGGFSGANSGVRKVTLTFPKEMNLTGNSEGTIDMKADVLKWFTPNNVKIASASEIMSVGNNSKMLADNYANMFSITDVSVAAE